MPPSCLREDWLACRAASWNHARQVLGPPTTLYFCISSDGCTSRLLLRTPCETTGRSGAADSTADGAAAPAATAAAVSAASSCMAAAPAMASRATAAAPAMEHMLHMAQPPPSAGAPSAGTMATAPSATSDLVSSRVAWLGELHIICWNVGFQDRQ